MTVKQRKKLEKQLRILNETIREYKLDIQICQKDLMNVIKNVKVLANIPREKATPGEIADIEILTAHNQDLIESLRDERDYRIMMLHLEEIRRDEIINELNGVYYIPIKRRK